MPSLSSVFGARTRPADLLPYERRTHKWLAARWVRWVAGVGPLRNPMFDETGAGAGIHQPDDVWFLAGTFGGDVLRRCIVPAGSPLFLPAFTSWHVYAGGPPPHQSRAFGTLTLDGEPVGLDVIATDEPFVVAGAARNPVTDTRRPVDVTVWGLWKKLDPLPVGQHVLRTTGGDGTGFTMSATYDLDVR